MINAISILLLCCSFPGIGTFLDNLSSSEPSFEKGYYGGQLSTKLEQGFYASMQEMAKENRFLSGIEEYSIYPSSYLGDKELKAYLAGDLSILKSFLDAKEAFFLDQEDLFYVDPANFGLSIGLKGDSFHVSLGTGREASYALKGAFLNAQALKDGQEAYRSLLTSFQDSQSNQAPSEKVKNAYAYLKKEATPCLTNETPSSSTSFGALIEKKADAFGYAKAMQALLKQVDVPSILTPGYRLSEEGRYEYSFYNKVQLDNKWFLLDVEACDKNNDDSAFLLGEKERSPRYIDDLSFNDSFAFGTPSLNKTKWNESSSKKQEVEEESSSPIATSLTPTNVEPLETLSRYSMEFIFDEELEKEDPSLPVEIAVTSTHEVKPGEYLLDDVRFDLKSNAVRFSFRPSSALLHQNEIYSFAVQNLIGKESKLAPEPISYSFHYETNRFDSSSATPTLWQSAITSPSFIASNDIEIQNSLLLHETSIGKEDVQIMSNAIGEGILSSSSMELSLSKNGKAFLLPEDAHVEVAFPYPGSYSPASEARSSFKLYRFSRDQKQDIDPASMQEIPCYRTPFGIVAEIESFSTFMLVETRKEEEEPMMFYSRLSSGKGEARFTSTNKGAATAFKDDLPSLKLIPEEGYTLSYALQNGEFLSIENDEVALMEEHLHDDNLIEVGFVSKEKLAREKEAGIQNLDGTFLSSLKGIDPLDPTSATILWTVIPILSLAAIIGVGVYLFELRKRPY